MGIAEKSKDQIKINSLASLSFILHMQKEEKLLQ